MPTGAKDPETAKAAKDGANKQPAEDAPASNEPAEMPCKKKHLLAVRVEFEHDGKVVESGIRMSLATNNGRTQDVDLKAGAQAGGKYSTGKILDSTDDCHVSFPDVYDAEIKAK